MFEKRGISPLIAEVIMISLVIAVGMLFVSWTDHFSSLSKEKTDERYQDTIACSGVIPQLDMFLIVKDSGNVKIIISNKGSAAYPIKRFEIYTSKGKCENKTSLVIPSGGTQIISLSCAPYTQINDCDEFRSLAIISNCIDKSLYLSNSLKDTGGSCKYENIYG